MMNYKLIDNVEVAGIDTKDYPDFCDAYIIYAEYNGEEMSEEQLDELNQDGDFVRNAVDSYLY
jgi:hypothetical protein